MQIYTGTTIDEGHPNERTFRVVRYDGGGWKVQGNRGALGWESRQTFYSLGAAIRAMEKWANDERARLASAKLPR